MRLAKKRTKLSILCLCLLLVGAWAYVEARTTVVVVGQGAAAPAGGPDAWYGPTVASTSYTGTGAALCQQITITQGGSLTKLSMNVSDKGSANLKLALYTSDGATLLSSGGSIANASITNSAWNDLTLGTPVSVTTSQVVMICINPSADMEFYKVDDAGTTGRYRSVSYANFPESGPVTFEDAGALLGLRVYVD